MIVEFEYLHRYRGRVAMVDGAFDPLHAGHLEYFRRTMELGLPVLCNVSGDHYVSRKHRPLLPECQRAAVVDALRQITYTHLSRTSTEDVLRALRPRYYVKGKDWDGVLPREQVDICREHEIEVVFLDTVSESSTRLLEKYVQAAREGEDVPAFEEWVLAQTPVRASHYDEHYFSGEWRADGNRYTVEQRRSIEGRHPALIQEVFQPSRVLDLGCGPGALLYLLREQGVRADGVDLSPRAREMAPAEVRDDIMIGSVTRPPVPERGYDLVICREVLEHLTVLEVREGVRGMVRASSRYIYLTTRFHPKPPGLLSITTQFELDPTHITLLNKDFLRVLFVLEGCRARPDLEARMDWMNKGRVLVYERVSGAAR